MMALITKVVGWTVAHWDAVAAGWRVFRALRGRRLATQVSGQSFKAYYLASGYAAIGKAAKVVAQGGFHAWYANEGPGCDADPPEEEK